MVLPIFINIVTIVSMPSDIFSYLDDRLKIDQCHLQETCLWPWRGTKKSEKKINLINKSSLLIRNNRLLDNKQLFSHPQFFPWDISPPLFFSYYPPPPFTFSFLRRRLICECVYVAVCNSRLPLGPAASGLPFFATKFSPTEMTYYGYMRGSFLGEISAPFLPGKIGFSATVIEENEEGWISTAFFFYLSARKDRIIDIKL